MSEHFEEISEEFYKNGDREALLISRLNEIIPSFGLHYACSDLAMLMKDNFDEFTACFMFETRVYETSELHDRFVICRRRLFNYLSTLHSSVDILFAVVNKLSDKSRAKILDSRVLKFKEVPVCRVGLKLRNRVQHAGLLNEVLSFSYRTAHHVNGEGVEYKFSSGADIWGAVREELNQESKLVLDTISQEKNPFIKLHELFILEFDKTIYDLKELSKIEQSPEFMEVKSIVSELENIEKWFFDNGSSSDIGEILRPIKKVFF